MYVEQWHGDLSLTWIGCAYRNVSWIGSIFGIGLASCGIFTIYLAVFNILADTYGQYASSALASQSFLRNMFGSGFRKSVMVPKLDRTKSISSLRSSDVQQTWSPLGQLRSLHHRTFTLSCAFHAFHLWSTSPTCLEVCYWRSRVA